MVFGFFTSIVPYIIAAGIYVVYLLLSVVQPSRDLIPEEGLTKESQLIVSEENSELPENNHNYNYEESYDKAINYSYNSGAPFFYEFRNPFHDSLSNSPPEYSIPMQFEYSVKILSDLFFRPPPVC